MAGEEYTNQSMIPLKRKRTGCEAGREPDVRRKKLHLNMNQYSKAKTDVNKTGKDEGRTRQGK
jgi:hypothetical protein